MTFHKGYFTVPCEWLPKEIERGNEKAVVVAIFGQSTVDSSGYKTTPLELMLGKNVLGRNLIHPITLPEKDLTGVEGYYDPYRRIVFLHLTGALDSSNLLKSINKLNDQLLEKGFLVVWSELRLQYARSLLLLFCMSHILLLWHPSHIFDITYIHLFRTLDTIRSKFQQNFIDILKNISGVSKDWQSVGRICSPRVLFIFSSRLIPYHVMKDTGNSNSNSGKSHVGNRLDKNVSTPLRKLELDLEYQIYRLLRKSRVITNISANSLFALPNNQPFVYVLEDFQDFSLNAPNMIKRTLSEICSMSSDISKALFTSVLGESKGLLNESGSKECSFISPLSNPQDSESLSHTLLSSMSTERKRNLEHSFNLFLKQHTDEALTRGFDDSVGRHATPNLFEVPKVSIWFEAFHKLHEYFVSAAEKDSEGNENQVVNSLRSNLETDIRFSDARCSKVLPLALSAYNEGLPTHYTRAHHQSKLEVALGILASQARGPMYEKYVKQLEETCDQIWQDGRIGCEALSLTGKTCHHQLHTVTKEPDSSLPVINHSSNIAYVSFCNCGRHQSPMEDPYSVKASNFDYYEKMMENICSVLEAFQFPSFKSSVDHARAAELNTKLNQDWSDELVDGTRISKDNPIVDTDTPQTPLELSIESAGLSQGLNANHPEIAEEGAQEDEIIVTVKEGAVRSQENNEEDIKGLGIDRQASTTEYLPTMLTTTSPAGLLPQFPSWSLVCLGPSSLYSHNAGICEQPGFLPGTNFLLPWDVTIKIRDKDKWPAIADSMGKKGFLLKNKKNRMGGDLSEFSVKIFLGTEYQCPRGHRFMMAAPDRHLKASSLGHVKDTAVKISNSDMPLYFPCPCSRRNSLVNGQLMRLHVVTPKAPVHVTLNPQIQPSPEPCLKFIPQPPSSPVIKLSASAYWILRLPFVYVGDAGPYYPPNPYQVNVSSYGKLLKGCYGISEITLDR